MTIMISFTSTRANFLNTSMMTSKAPTTILLMQNQRSDLIVVQLEIAEKMALAVLTIKKS